MNHITTNTNKIQLYNSHYTLFCNNINPSLKLEIGIEQNESVNNTFFSDWKAPSTYGLNNSKRIIPEHYFENDKKYYFKEIDMYYELIKDIRNLRPLNDIQMSYIKTLPKEKILELLDVYNLCLKTIDEALSNK